MSSIWLIRAYVFWVDCPSLYRQHTQIQINTFKRYCMDTYTYI